MLHRPDNQRALANDRGATRDGMATAMSLDPGVEIFGESEPAEYFYRVLDGAVRSYKVLEDGRRQITDFYLPGDFFGLEIGPPSSSAEAITHSSSVEAITKCRLLVIKHRTLFARARTDLDLAYRLWRLEALELRRSQNHLLLLNRDSLERVVAFLLMMVERHSVDNFIRHSVDNFIELPMSRWDIADYLGLTIETVARTLSQLKNSGAIEIKHRRRIVLRNRSALELMLPRYKRIGQLGSATGRSQARDQHASAAPAPTAGPPRPYADTTKQWRRGVEGSLG